MDNKNTTEIKNQRRGGASPRPRKKEAKYIRRFFVYLVAASLVLTPIFVGAQQAEIHSGKSYPDSVVIAQAPGEQPLAKEAEIHSGKSSSDRAVVIAQTPGEQPPAKEGDCDTAKTEGAKEGDRETNRFGWVVVGAFFPLFGPFIAAGANPGQPSEAALHFSANPACFTQGYRNKKKSGRIKSALFGSLLILSLEVLFIVADRSSEPQY